MKLLIVALFLAFTAPAIVSAQTSADSTGMHHRTRHHRTTTGVTNARAKGGKALAKAKGHRTHTNKGKAAMKPGQGS